MKKTIALVGAAAVLLAGCQRATTVESGGDVSPSVVTPANSSMIPSGTVLNVRLNERLNTEATKVGDRFTASVTTALTASNGATVVPAGAVVHGSVTGIDDSDNAGEAAAIRLDFDRISMNGREYPFEARIEEANVQQSGESRDETIKKAGIGAAAGAVLGAIIGEGDVGKILGGAAIGAAAGTIISLGLGDVNAELPAGTQMTLRTTSDVSLR